MTAGDSPISESSCPTAEELQAFSSERLVPDRTAGVTGHIEQCDVCRAKLEALRAAETRQGSGVAAAVGTKGESPRMAAAPSSRDEQRRPRTIPWLVVGLAAATVMLLFVCPVGIFTVAWMYRENNPEVYYASPSVATVSYDTSYDVSVSESAFPDFELVAGQAGEPVALLPLLDPQRDIRGDDWSVVDGAVISRADAPSMLQFGYRPPDHYRWEATVERIENSESLGIGLVAGGEPLILAVDGYPSRGSFTGMYRIDGRGANTHRENVYRGQVLPTGQPVRLVAWVRYRDERVHVRLDADGREIFSWRGYTRRANSDGQFPTNDRGAMFLGNWTAALRVSDIQVIPLDGTGEVIDFVDRDANRELAAAQRALWSGGMVMIDEGGVTREVGSLGDLTSQFRVVEIDMQGSAWLDDEDLLYFSKLADLRRLDLSGTAITAQGLMNLGPLPALTEISLADTGIVNEYPQLAADCPALEKINLEATGVGDATLAALIKLPQLSDLNASATGVSDAGLAELEGPDELRVLNLNQTALTADGLRRLSNLPRLERLSVSRTRVNDVAFMTREAFPSLSRLELLETAVTDEAVAAVREALDETQVVSGLGATDLLGFIDPARDAFAGDWEWAVPEKALRIPAGGPARLSLPVTLPDEFDLEIVATRESGANAPVFGLPLPSGGRALVGFDHWPDRGNYVILHGIDGRMEMQSPAKVQRTTFRDNGTPERLTIRMRNGSVQVEQNGESVLTWAGDVSQLAAAQQWFHADRERPTITLYGGQFIIDELTLTPVSGRLALPAIRGGAESTVDLTDRGVTDETLPLALEGESPTRLILFGPEITDSSMPLVASLPLLQRLELRRTDVTDAGLAALGGHPALSRLELWYMPQITEAATEHIAEIPRLDQVVLKHTGIFGPGLERLHGRGLRGLYLGNKQIDGEILQQYILPFGTLGALDFAGCGITNDDLSLLTNMEITNFLHLGYNQGITGPGLEHLADLPGVRNLNLNGSGVDDAGLEHLTGVTQLVKLLLIRTSVGDASVETIAELENLREVNLTDTNLTEDGVARLQELLPDTRIIAEHLNSPDGDQ